MKVNDYVCLKETINNITANSIGIVKEVSTNTLKVFFIGKNKQIVLQKTKVKLIDVLRTGKPHKYKICNVCHILKTDFEDFEVNQTDSKGRKTTRPSCRECRKKIDGVKLKGAEKKKLEQIKPTTFFICPICKKGSIPSVTANLVKDHDHNTGKARAWLCDSCNTGLGRFKDDVKLLKRAISYLESFDNKESK